MGTRWEHRLPAEPSPAAAQGCHAARESATASIETRKIKGKRAEPDAFGRDRLGAYDRPLGVQGDLVLSSEAVGPSNALPRLASVMGSRSSVTSAQVTGTTARGYPRVTDKIIGQPLRCRAGGRGSRRNGGGRP